MKRLLLLLAVFFAFWACSNEKDIAGISTVETENAFLIQVVREDSLPAANVVARMRSADFVRSVDADSAKAEFFNEYVTDSLGCIRIDSLAVDVATLEIVDRGEGLFRKISAEDVQDGDSVRFVMEKTGNLRGKVYLPEDVDYAWVQVYGIDRLVILRKCGLDKETVVCGKAEIEHFGKLMLHRFEHVSDIVKFDGYVFGGML